MGDAENTLPPLKKRVAGRELTKDNAGLEDDEETFEHETGTFKKASGEVLASRRIVKVRRSSTSSTPSTNPFAGIQLIPSAVSKTATPEAPAKVENDNNGKEETVVSNDDAKQPERIMTGTEEVLASRRIIRVQRLSRKQPESKADAKEETANEANKSEVEGEKSTEEGEKAEADDKKDGEVGLAENKDEEDKGNESIEKTEETASLSSFQQLSSTQNAFTGIVGTGFSSSAFSFGAAKDGSSASCGSGFAFNFANNNNNGSSLFGTQGGSGGTKNVGFSSEVSVETGEEYEVVVFTADSVLFEFFEGGWKERGKGEVKVNVPTAGTGKARLVMRSKGNYRLILNASLYPDIKLTNMDKKGITFACVNNGGEGKQGLSTFALKFKDVSFVEEFRSVVTEHKNRTSGVLKTPENSPKASDE